LFEEVCCCCSSWKVFVVEGSAVVDTFREQEQEGLVSNIVLLVAFDSGFVGGIVNTVEELVGVFICGGFNVAFVTFGRAVAEGLGSEQHIINLTISLNLYLFLLSANTNKNDGLAIFYTGTWHIPQKTKSRRKKWLKGNSIFWLIYKACRSGGMPCPDSRPIMSANS
jgi:hypothetical protein